jgi:hypothetical protein
MTAAIDDAQCLVKDLLVVLDEEIRLEEAAVGHLRGLAGAVLARDEGRAERLMAEAGDTQAGFEEVESRRHALCEGLASALGRPRAEVTLRRLVREMPAPEAEAIDARRRQLERLAGEVRRQYLRTAALVWHSVHLNRALLLGLFPQMESARTYESGGTAQPQPGGGLVDARS